MTIPGAMDDATRPLSTSIQPLGSAVLNGGRSGKIASERLDRSALLLVGLCSLMWLLDGMVPAMLGPLAPSVAQALQLSKAELGPVFSADLVGQSVGLLFVPVLSRWIKNRDVIWIAMIGFGVCQALSGLAPDRDTLIAFRLLTGFFVGGALPAGLAIVAAGVPASRRGTAIMLLTTGYGTGKALSGVIVGLAGGDAWRSIFGVSGIVCVFAAIAVWMWMPAPEVEDVQPTTSNRPRAPFMRMLAPRLLGGTILLWMIFICSLTINYCLASWLPTLLVGSGRGTQTAAFAYSIFAVGGILATLSYGPLIDRFGTFRTLSLSYGIGAIFLLIAGLQFHALGDAALLSLIGAAGFFILGSYGGINVVLATFYPPDLRAVGAGWSKGIGRVGTTIAPIMIGLALSAGVTESHIMSLFAIPAVACMALLSAVGLIVRKQS